jgi:hypothetical protein
MNNELWGYYYMVVNETDMSVTVIDNRTADAHYNVTWVKTICPNCVTVKLKNFNPDTRLFYLELHTMNPTFKIGHDVRFIIDLDGTKEYDLVNPDNYTRLFDGEGLPNPFRALAADETNRAIYPKESQVDSLTLYISEAHSPLTNIPFIIETSYPNRCQEPYWIKDIVITGEFPPGGGGSAKVDCTVWDSQDDHGEVWLRTAGIFTAGDIQMTAGALVGTHGRKYSATFSNTVGGGSGLTPILIEAYTTDTVVEPFPLNDYARIYADPGGASAIAGDIFDALNKTPITSNPFQTLVNITNTSGGGSPLPYEVTDGTYFVTVVAGTYSVNVTTNLYQLQSTLYDAVVPADTTVLVCFGMAPKWLTTPGSGIATISGVCRDSSSGDPIPGVGVTLDGGPSVGGIIQSRVTDNRGHYCFYAVPTQQQAIYTVHAFHPEYVPQDYLNVNSAKNRSTPQIDFDLVKTTADALWAEDFETGSSNVGTKQDWFWSRVASEAWWGGETGNTTYHDQSQAGDILWRVTDPTSPPFQCTFYVNGISTLPPDDITDAYMPEAYQGHRYMWHGEELDNTPPSSPHSGSFIDEWDGNTSPGGTSSIYSTAGVARTGPINLTGYTELTLTLQTWWEIESVDPSIQYDAMDILISKDTVSWDRLDRLNPLAEPIPDDAWQNAPKPYTSAGFFQAAVWSPVVLDLSAYGGSTVYLRFDFDTIDPLYNGFRSWVVDDIQIWPYSID